MFSFLSFQQLYSNYCQGNIGRPTEDFRKLKLTKLNTSIAALPQILPYTFPNVSIIKHWWEANILVIHWHWPTLGTSSQRGLNWHFRQNFQRKAKLLNESRPYAFNYENTVAIMSRPTDRVVVPLEPVGLLFSIWRMCLWNSSSSDWTPPPFWLILRTPNTGNSSHVLMQTTDSSIQNNSHCVRFWNEYLQKVKIKTRYYIALHLTVYEDTCMTISMNNIPHMDTQSLPIRPNRMYRESVWLAYYTRPPFRV